MFVNKTFIRTSLFFIILLFFCISNCKNHGDYKCKIDEVFKSKFYKDIEVIRNYYKNHNDSLLKEFAKSYDYIFSVTHIKGQETRGYMGVYYTGDAVKKLSEDITKWEEWYQKNKCWITIEKADSTYLKYINSSSNIHGLTIVPREEFHLAWYDYGATSVQP